MIKNYSDTLFDEIKLLAKFPQQSHLEGLKIHKTATDETIKAAKSLFDKGLITRDDGGYLTDLGIEISEHMFHVLNALK